MSTSVTDAQNGSATRTEPQTSPKGKGKSKATTEDVSMDEDHGEEDDEEDEEDENEDEEAAESDEEEEEEFEEIDPSAIVGRRTRGIKVDYTSKEALAKAGLTSAEDEDEEMD